MYRLFKSYTQRMPQDGTKAGLHLCGICEKVRKHHVFIEVTEEEDMYLIICSNCLKDLVVKAEED